MSTPKWFWVYIKNWACLKNLSMLEPNFEEADGLGISIYFIWIPMQKYNCHKKVARGQEPWDGELKKIQEQG